MAESTNDKLLAMAQDVITGAIFSDEEVYAEWREAFGTFAEGVAEVCRAHDVGLKSLLEKNGRDSFPGEFFRTPRGWAEDSPKVKTNTLSKLTL
jgi:hypothetical protein